jgi:uncharacterized protein (TIGR00369 family)
VSRPASGASRGKIQARNCFVCGYHNPRGLNVPFYYDNEKIAARFTPADDLCGFESVVHGGILFSLCDEAMMHLIWASGHRAITAEITMRFHRHAEAGKEILVSASFESIGSHLIKAECQLSDSGGRIATARGKFLPMSEEEKLFFRKKF